MAIWHSRQFEELEAAERMTAYGLIDEERSGVSVIIPVYNRHEFLADAIRSVVATQYSPLEIIVVDDGSTDQSAELARRFALELGDWIKVISHEGRRNCGPSASRNLGVAHASYAYIAFLDSDDTYLPSRFDRCITILDDDASVDAVVEASKTEFLYGGESRRGTVNERLVPARDGDVLQDRLSGKLGWAISAITMRKDIFERVGGFGTTTPVGEDAVLWDKLALVGKIEIGQDRPVSVYRLHGGNISNTDIRVSDTTFRVMREVYRWGIKARINRDQLAVYAHVMNAKCYFIVSELRKAGRPVDALRVIFMCMFTNPILALQWRTWKNLACSLREIGLRAK